MHHYGVKCARLTLKKKGGDELIQSQATSWRDLREYSWTFLWNRLIRNSDSELMYVPPKILQSLVAATDPTESIDG